MQLLSRAWNAALTRPWVPPVLAGIVFHLPSLCCAFVYDDVSLVAEHPRLGSASFLAEIWQRDYGQEFVGENRGFYRPAFMTLVFVLRNLCGASPFVFHLFSLAVFCLAIYLVVRVASAFDTRRTGILPLLAGVLYAVHPARVETVSLVMSLPDLIVECCALGLVLAWLGPAAGVAARVSRAGAAVDTAAAAPNPVRGWRTAALCGVLALLATLSKESAFFVVPALAGTAALFALRADAAARRCLLAAAGAALAALAVAFLLRHAAQVQAPVPLVKTAQGLLFGGRAPDTLLGLMLAARDVVLPGPAVFWRSIFGTHLPGAVLLLVLSGFAIAGAWLCTLRRNHLPLALLAAWAGANAANLALLLGAGYVYSQRYLAFAPAAILLCLLVRALLVLGAQRWPAVAASCVQHRPLAVLGISAFLTAQGAFTLAGSATCLTPMSFFLAMERANPSDVVPAGAVAETLNRVGKAEEVEQRVRRAASLDCTHPQVPRLQNMLIQRYLADGRFPDALRCAEWARAMYPKDADKQVLHAVAVANLGRPDLARQEVETVLAKNPDHAAAKQLLDQIVKREGKVIGQ